MITHNLSTQQSAYTDPEALAAVLMHVADLAAETDADGAFPEEAFQLLAGAGLLAVTLPGQPLDNVQGHTAQLLTLLKRIGAANLAVGRVYEGHINALLLAQLFGTPGQQQQWQDDVRQSHLFSVWNTQADDGIRIHELGGGRYELEGYKTFCSGANWVTRPLITGELMRQGHKAGWQMCIIPTERVGAVDADTRFWKPLGMRASASIKLDFTGIVIDENDLLGRPGDYFQQPYFSGGAIRFAAVQLGGADALLEATRLMLRSMGRTEDVFQQTRLAEMACRIESGNLWLAQAGANNDQWLRDGTDPAKIVAYANMTRTVIEEICLRVMHLCEKSVGARGLLRPLPFERIHRDLTMYLRQPAPDATLVDIGRWVGHQTTATHDLWT